MTAPEPTTHEHRGHDIHGVIVVVHPDGSSSLDPMCPCPTDCLACEEDE